VVAVGKKALLRTWGCSSEQCNSGNPAVDANSPTIPDTGGHFLQPFRPGVSQLTPDPFKAPLPSHRQLHSLLLSQHPYSLPLFVCQFANLLLPRCFHFHRKLPPTAYPARPHTLYKTCPGKVRTSNQQRIVCILTSPLAYVDQRCITILSNL
jgi:hypothetical protein